MSYADYIRDTVWAGTVSDDEAEIIAKRKWPDFTFTDTYVVLADEELANMHTRVRASTIASQTRQEGPWDM